MRKTIFTKGEYYHIYNRGVEKRDIFLDDHDRWRFMTLLISMQGDHNIPQISRIVPDVKHLGFDKEIFRKILKKQGIVLSAFCLMSNHFHLLLSEIHDHGISNYMMKIGNAYTKYFNAKYSRSGHLFGGAFQAVHVDTNEYLNHVSAYIHLNPHSMAKWKGKEAAYHWSSFQDYNENRWGKFLNPGIILDQFNNAREHCDFVRSGNSVDMLEDKYLIDP